MKIPFLAYALLALSCVPTTRASIIIGSDTQGKSASYTTGDGLVTLFAYSSLAPLTAGNFNTNPGFIGVAGGTNSNGVDDTDGNPATLNDREAMDLQFDPTVGLESLTLGYSRADGPNFTDGIVITGFSTDPGATGTGVYATAGQLRWDNALKIFYAETIYVNGINGTINFSNPSASAGQTLRITATDSTQGGPLAAIQSITYVPEPSIALLGGFGLLGLIRRRR